MKKLLLLLFLASLSQNLSAGAPIFKSHLFKQGTLIYSDDFDGKLDRKRWEPRTKTWEVKNGILVGLPDYKNAKDAMKALGRDHHLGLEPVVHLNRIPEQFVCHLRYKFETAKLTPGRPAFQIGHHMIAFNYLEGGGHRITLPDGPSFTEPESEMKLNEWIDLVIEYKKGEIRISVNGYSKTYEHEKVTIINEKEKLGPRFSFKGGPDCRITAETTSNPERRFFTGNLEGGQSVDCRVTIPASFRLSFFTSPFLPSWNAVLAFETFVRWPMHKRLRIEPPPSQVRKGLNPLHPGAVDCGDGMG